MRRSVLSGGVSIFVLFKIGTLNLEERELLLGLLQGDDVKINLNLKESFNGDVFLW